MPRNIRVGHGHGAVGREKSGFSLPLKHRASSADQPPRHVSGPLEDMSESHPGDGEPTPEPLAPAEAPQLGALVVRSAGVELAVGPDQVAAEVGTAETYRERAYAAATLRAYRAD
jgi:hypothetical protein